MAIDLRAILRLDDRMSDPMRRVQREMQRSQRIMDQMRNSTNQAGSAANRTSSMFSSFGRTIGGAVKNVLSLRSGLIGLVGAYASVASAQKIFEATVGTAMKREQSYAVIGAMFDDKGLTKSYIDMMKTFAVDSPILDFTAMLGNSKSLISASKDIGTLEKMWSLVERMAAIDPYQGTEGAVFALKELMSGDAISMMKRFEMPVSKDVMNEIKNLPLQEQLTALDDLFTKFGWTQKLIDDMANTTLGKWGTIKEKFTNILDEMGKPSLDVLSNFFDGVLKRFDSEDFQRFGRVGGRIIENIISGLTSASTGVYDWFTNLINSPEWQERTTIVARLTFVIDDLYARFTKWMDDKGRGYLESAAKNLIEVGAVALLAAEKPIVETAATIGKSIGKALASSAGEEFKSSISSWINDSWIMKATVPGLVISGANWIKNRGGAKPETNNGGLDYVPYTNYPASLGKGEAILSRGEADQWRSGKDSGNTYQFSVTLNGSGSTEKDAKQLFEYFVREIEAAGGAGA